MVLILVDMNREEKDLHRSTKYSITRPLLVRYVTKNSLSDEGRYELY